VAQLPPAASVTRTEAVVHDIAAAGLTQPGVSGAVQFTGLSINNFAASSNAGLVFFPLDSFDERGSKDKSALAITGALNMKMAGIKDAFVGVFPPPPILGLGTLGGFKLNIEDRGDL